MGSAVSYLAPARGSSSAPPSGVRKAGAAPARPRLLDRVRAALRHHHYSRCTEDTDVAWIRRYVLFHGKRHMGATELTAFPSSLAVDRRVAASTQNQALTALLFLYRDVLEVDVPWLDDLVRVKRLLRLPVVLTREEVRAVLQRLNGVPRLSWRPCCMDRDSARP